jgi:NTE family protein
MLQELMTFWYQRLQINFLRDPYFWAFFSLAGLFFWVAFTNLRIGKYRQYFDLLSIVVFVSGQIMLVMPTTDGERLGWGSWRLVIGLVFFGLCLMQLVTAVLYMRALFNPAKQNAYTRLLRRTGGIYSMIRYPFFMAGLFFTIGASIIFNSLIGLVLQPVWWAAFLILLRVEARQLRRDLGGYFDRYQKRLFTTLLPWKALIGIETLPAYPFENLVFKGGGARGLAYIGAMKALEEKQILPQVKRVAGTSAGALVALLAAMKIHHSQWAAVMRSFDRHTVMNRDGGKFKLRNLARLESEYGLFSTDSFYEWLQELIAEHCQGNGLATFRDFHQMGLLDLSVVASDLTTRDEKIFNRQNTPNIPVADAVRMSISIPLYFSALRHDGRRFGQGNLFVDGGLFNNYPIHLFDSHEFADRNPWYLNRINWQTLGFYLYPDTSAKAPAREVRNLIDYLSLLMNNVLLAQGTLSFESSTVDQQRSVKINDCGVSPTDFDVVLPTEEFDTLVHSGYTSTMDYLESYQLPIEGNPAILDA